MASLKLELVSTAQDLIKNLTNKGSMIYWIMHLEQYGVHKIMAIIHQNKSISVSWNKQQSASILFLTGRLGGVVLRKYQGTFRYTPYVQTAAICGNVYFILMAVVLLQKRFCKTLHPTFVALVPD